MFLEVPMRKNRIEIASGPDREEFASMFLEKAAPNKPTGRGNVNFLLENARLVIVYVKSIERVDESGTLFNFTGERGDKKVSGQYSFETKDGYILL